MITATDGNDPTLNGGKGRDQISGLAGADWPSGSAGDDLLLGGEGFDTLNGGSADDLLMGASADLFRVDSSAVDGSDHDTILDLDFASGDRTALKLFAAGICVSEAGGNLLTVVSGGAGAIIDSMAGLVEQTRASPRIWAQAGDLAGSLMLTIRGVDHDIQMVRINKALAGLFLAAACSEFEPACSRRIELA